MALIHVLSEETIDKIAAGEVVERPASVIKELVENAIDAGATAITVEIKEGGIKFIRVTDNGSGLQKEQIATAFLRHATSKIDVIEDLYHLESLGFRGEALSSIAAVGQVELITKTAEELIGTRYVIEGSHEKSIDEIGAPKGTTFIVRNLFFNTPARRKFLKSAVTEGSYVSELMEHLALSNPHISFQFISNGQNKLQTSGRGDLKEVIFRIYGKQTVDELISINTNTPDISITGYIAKPVLVRNNRNFETFFVNGRYVKSTILTKALESSYKPFLMQHRFPFAILHIKINGEAIDINVHPTKMEIRFSDNSRIYDFMEQTIAEALKQREFIPEVCMPEAKMPESNFLQQTGKTTEVNANKTTEVNANKSTELITNESTESNTTEQEFSDTRTSDIKRSVSSLSEPVIINQKNPEPFEANRILHEKAEYKPIEPVQYDLFETKLLTKEARQEYKIIGQIFNTYWIVEYKEKVMFIDQHAAHEKVLYEKFINLCKNRQICSQQLNPAMIITVTGKEEEILNQYKEHFSEMGFEIEHFGGNEYAVCALPEDFTAIHSKDLFLEILDDLSDERVLSKDNMTDLIRDRIATMACKAAVKGNNRLSEKEAYHLIDELLELENPYHCPHGRPTIISMTRQEMEKKFKRIVD